MSRRNRTRSAWGAAWLAAVGARIASIVRRARQALCSWRHPVPVEVLLTDRGRRRALEGELRAGLRQLRRALGTPLPANLAVVVQQVIRTDRQLAGCYQVGQREDGARFALIRLAVQVNGRRLSTDELLAALAEQCIGLMIHDGGGPSVLVPVEFEPASPAEGGRLTTLRPDPLAPRSNGGSANERVA